MTLPVLADVSERAPASGLGAVPETWIPMGVHQCFACSPWGQQVARISRTPEAVEFGLEQAGSPHVVCTNLGEGRARVRFHVGFRRVEFSGRFAWRGDHAHFLDEEHVFTADLYRTLAGKIVLELYKNGERIGSYFLLF